MKAKKLFWYESQLLDPRWIAKRNRILRRDRYRCRNCKSSENLNVHHNYYIIGKKAWEHPNSCLITLCETCHKLWHLNNKIEYRVSKKRKK